MTTEMSDLETTFLAMQQELQEIRGAYRATQDRQEENGNLQNMVQELQAQVERLEAARLVGQRQAPLPEVNGVDQELRGSTKTGLGWKPAKPATYRGVRDVTIITAWIFRMDEYLAIGNVSDAAKSKLAASFLDGEAFIWYRALAEKLREQRYIPWDYMKNELLKYFSPPNADAMWLDRWDKIQQITSVAQYVAQFQTVVTHLQNMPEALVLEHFIRRLKPKLQLEVTLRKPQSLDEAIEIADRYDVLTRSNTTMKFNGKGSWIPRYTATPTNTSSMMSSKSKASSEYYGTPMELDNLMVHQMQSTSSRFNKLVTKAFTGKCFNCGKVGHRIKECRQPRNTPTVEVNLTELETKNQEC
jgi:hypothetical protein